MNILIIYPISKLLSTLIITLIYVMKTMMTLITLRTNYFVIESPQDELSVK